MNEDNTASKISHVASNSDITHERAQSISNTRNNNSNLQQVVHNKTKSNLMNGTKKSLLFDSPSNRKNNVEYSNRSVSARPFEEVNDVVEPLKEIELFPKDFDIMQTSRKENELSPDFSKYLNHTIREEKKPEPFPVETPK